MVEHAKTTFAAIVEAMGGTVRNRKGVIEPGGKVIHEVGGALMGDDPSKSVCNAHNQTWDVKNLFLCDGSPFPSNANKNPTLTIMALAWRAADHLIERVRKGEL